MIAEEQKAWTIEPGTGVPGMTSSPQIAESLSVHRTFVVQLHGGAAAGHYSGRVEHVASGRWGQFSTLEALLDFLVANSDTAANHSSAESV
jgi:hypothetical protein